MVFSKTDGEGVDREGENLYLLISNLILNPDINPA